MIEWLLESSDALFGLLGVILGSIGSAFISHKLASKDRAERAHLFRIEKFESLCSAVTALYGAAHVVAGTVDGEKAIDAALFSKAHALRSIVLAHFPVLLNKANEIATNAVRFDKRFDPTFDPELDPKAIDDFVRSISDLELLIQEQVRPLVMKASQK